MDMKARVKKVLKRMVAVVGVLVLLFAVSVIWSTVESRHRIATREEYNETHKEEIEAQAKETEAKKKSEFLKLDFKVEDSDEDLAVDTYRESSTGMLNVFDSAYLDKYFDYPSLSVDDVKRTLEANQNIPDRHKATIGYFIDRVHTLYPGTDLRPFEFNLRTLEVVEVDEWHMGMASLNSDAYACYNRVENRIYLPQDKVFEPGGWDWQVIIHELSHALRTVDYDEDRSYWEGSFRYLITSPDHSNEIGVEALNSLFAVSLLEYEERDIAYQLQSNMVGVMLECMDNYTLADYPNHSYSYFLSKLDEVNGDHNYAESVLRLMEAQRDDWAEERWERPQKTYYPLYDYICKMWLNKHAEPGMSEDELDALVDTLVERVMFDVPEKYHIDTKEFSRYAQSYYAKRFGEEAAGQ